MNEITHLVRAKGGEVEHFYVKRYLLMWHIKRR